nr:DUF2971 domain-containing protein [uncultured Methanoregula sp.]
MKFSRFEELIRNTGLYFSRWDMLGEPFEGSCPDDYLKQKKGGWGRTPWGRAWGSPYYRLKKFSNAERNLMYICCFCNKNHELTHMWDKYSELNQGIAIRTTLGRLKESLRDESPNEIHIRRVKYSDFDKDSFKKDLDLISLFSLKKNEFSGENEIRMIIKNDPPNPTFSDRGGYVRIDPADLIEEIVLYPKPGAEDIDIKLLNNVQRILDQNNLNIPVRNSTLSKKPQF